MQLGLIIGGQEIIHNIPDIQTYSDDDQRLIMYRLAKNDPQNIIAFRQPQFIDLTKCF